VVSVDACRIVRFELPFLQWHMIRSGGMVCGSYFEWLWVAMRACVQLQRVQGLVHVLFWTVISGVCTRVWCVHETEQIACYMYGCVHETEQIACCDRDGVSAESSQSTANAW